MFWHVAQTEAFMGALAERSLADKSDRLEAGWRVFHPVVETVQRWSRGRTKVTERPYFPGYIFVGVDEPGDWRHVNYARGIKDKGVILAAEDVPAKVSPDIIAKLMGRCDERMVGQLGTEPGLLGKLRLRYYIRQEEADEFLFRVGQQVKLTDGPFATFGGPVKEADRSKVLVDVFVFGRWTPVTVAPGQLELV